MPHLYLWKSAKWVTGLDLMIHDKRGFWEELGYNDYGEPEYSNFAVTSKLLRFEAQN